MASSHNRHDAVTSRLRLRGHDYSLPGNYFVTAVTSERHCFFGHIVDMDVHLTDAGKAVAVLWESIPRHFPVTSLDAWVLMPNHLHGIISITSMPNGEPDPTAPTVSAILQWFKTRSTLVYGNGVREFGWRPYPGHLWQPGFHDRELRNERELVQKRAYIEANPSQWHEDMENPVAGGVRR